MRPEGHSQYQLKEGCRDQLILQDHVKGSKVHQRAGTVCIITPEEWINLLNGDWLIGEAHEHAQRVKDSS